MELLKKVDIKTIVLYGIYLILMLFLFTRKENFQIDEVNSFCLANQTEWFHPVDDVKYTPAQKPFLEAAAGTGEIDLSRVWEQQARDTHPPLFYLLLHLICSRFPGSVSVRYPALINILFQLLTFFFFRKLLRIFLPEERLHFFLSVMYVFNAGILSNVLFLRMYIMLMFWVTLLSYVLIKHLEQFRVRDCFCIAGIVLGGALTQYYFLIYGAFIFLCIGGILVLEKRYREILPYILAWGGGACLAVAIFPAMISHLFFGGRGKQSINGLVGGDFFSRFAEYYQILDVELLGGFLIFFISLAALTLLVIYLNGKAEHLKKEKRLFLKQYLCLLVPTILYLMVIIKSAPYITDRYIVPVYTVLLVCVYTLILKCLNFFILNRQYALRLYVFSFVFMLALPLKNCQWTYLYSESRPMLDWTGVHGEYSDAIVVYDTDWMIWESYLEIAKCQSVTFYHGQSYDAIKNLLDLNEYGDELAFFLIGLEFNYDRFLDAFLEEHPEYELRHENGPWGYGDSFYLQKKT